MPLRIFSPPMIRARLRRLTRMHWAAFFFLAAVLAAGLILYRDYGIAWDEPTQVELGIKTYRYVMKNDPTLLGWRDRLYGPFFEILLVIFQHRGASREMYMSRHLLTFLAFWGGCVGFFALAHLIFKKTWLALTGTVLLVFSPRIFADAFYNSKDIPFLVFYIFTLLTLFLLLRVPHPLLAIIHGVFTAALVAIRLPGMVILALTLAGLLLEVISRRIPFRKAGGLYAAYLAATLPAILLFWPALWPDPPAALLEAIRMMSNFPHETGMLYMGEMIASLALPWHYLPVWISISTPIPYLLLFAIGVVSICWRWIQNPRVLLTPSGRNAFLVAASLFLPLAAILFFGSTLYDGWRQAFFLYAPLLLIGLYGVDFLVLALSNKQVGQPPARFLAHQSAGLLMIGLLLLGVLPTAAWMVRNHPYQNLYFNRLAGPDMRAIQQRYMLDYWGLAYREGLAYILNADPGERIPIYAETAPGQRNAAIFPTSEEKRLHFIETVEQAKYYIGNYYLNVEGYPFSDEIYTVWVGNARILSVFLLTEEEKR
jgi:hypothetical protein